MKKLDWGNELKFCSVAEYYETLGFLSKDDEVVRVYIEHNEESGARGPQGRLRVRKGNYNFFPEPLKRLFNSSANGKTSETLYVRNLKDEHHFLEYQSSRGKGQTYILVKSSLADVKATVPEQFLSDFMRGYLWNYTIDKHQLIIDEVASKIVKRIFKEYLSGNSMYRIACNLNAEEVMTPGVYIARQDGNEKMLQRYTKQSPHWSAVAIKRILENQQYTGAMIYNRFESKAVGSRNCITLPKDEWKCVEGCHKAIISKKDFEKTAEILKQNSKNVMDGSRHEKHCLTGKIICGDCGHSMAHTYAGRPKHYCKSRYLDPSKAGCNFNIIDAEIESVILKMLQQYTDAMVDSRSIIDFKRKQEAERLQNAEKHLADMEHTRELMQKDLRYSYEAYRFGTTNKETYLEQKQMYEQLEQKLQENILIQQDAIKHIADIDVPKAAGLEMLDGKIQLKKLTREMVDTFIDKIVVYGEKEIEVKWRFKEYIFKK